MFSRAIRRQTALKSLRAYSQTSADGYIVSTLENGVKVATSPIPCHFSAVGAYISAGSRYEIPAMCGTSHLMDRLSFKSTKSYSQEEMEEQLLALGGNYMCSSSRETMLYQASTFHGDFKRMVKLIGETVVSPKLLPEEIQEQVLNAEYEIQEIWQKPELILPELLHQTAFSDGLGRPLLAPADRLPLLTPGVLWQYRHQLYTAPRTTLAFLGVSHEEAVEMATEHFGSLPSGEVTPFQKSVYTGGERTCPMPRQIGQIPQFAHLHVAYRGVGINDEDVYAIAVLQTMLGGGGSFSAGGPGKGMYSRLYTQVLNQYGFVESATGINHAYADDGLFGIACSVVPDHSEYAAYVVGTQLASLMDAKKMRPAEVSRSKNQLRSQLLMNLESRMVELEDLGRQVQLNGSKMPVSEMIKKIDALTAEDLAAAAKRVLTSSEPTLVMMGEREKFGDVAHVLKELGLGKQ